MEMRKVLKVKAFAGLVAIVLHLTLAKGFQRDVYGMAGVLSHFEHQYNEQSGSTDTWTITVPIGYNINLTIVYFKGSSNTCPDNIEVKDVLSNQIVECNSNSPSIYSSKQRVLQVIFKDSAEYFATFTALNGNDKDGCDHDWKLLDDSCYKLFGRSAARDKDKANKQCQDNSASLTSVNTKQENDMLRAMLKQQQQQQHSRDTVNKVLIGLKYDVSSKKFVHIDNTPVIFSAWIKPRKPLSNDFCFTLQKNGSWSESQCGLKHNYYSCEKRVLSRNIPYKECSLPVGLKNQSMVNISASTQDANFIANSARLYGNSGWVPENGDSQPWIEISFESPFLVTAFATQGIENRQWVARFSLSFVLYDKRYVNFTNPRRQIVYFEGNRDAHNVAYNRLPYPIIAKTVRLVPEETQSIGLRMEFYGCQSKEAYVNCSQPLGLETSAVPDELMTGSSHHPSSPPHNARLNIDLDSQFSCWSPSIHDTDQWLQIDFRSNRNRVTAIATQGRGDDEVEEWVTKYALSYAQYGNHIFTYYKENNLRKNFRGNSDKATVVKNTLDPAIVVFALRIHPLEWKNNISMRLEVYGCQANDSYTAWGNWSDCNAWCNGLQNRTRHCKSSYPHDCLGPLVESRRCNISNCFSSWTNWTECNQTCGSGVRNRTKYYLGDFSNKTCNGSITEIGECNTDSCDAWSTCNMTCGIGFKKRYINCNDSSQPSSCETQVHQCNRTTKPGIVDSNWSYWSDCKSTCGGIYYQERSRSSMSNNNNLVYNPEVESRECVYLCNESCICTWSNWTDCNATCGGGARTRLFNCSYTSSGLVNCSGSIHDTMVCNNFSCPVNGSFTEWSNWTDCTATCGNGTRQRMRNCTNPLPAHGGKNCTGNTTEIQECRTRPCPVNGNFTEWGNWTDCTATCGNGTRQRMRNCTNPLPAHGGKNCTGNTTEIQICVTQPCPETPIHGNFTEWSPWTNCTKSCGTGTQGRTRTCTSPPPANGGANCSGHTHETQNCHTHHCPIHGGWTSWSEWSYCNRPCGMGYENSTRSCTKPAPMYGGRECAGPTNRSRTCNNFTCPAAEVLVNVHFTKENWTNDLVDLTSEASRKLKEKILKNLQKIYEGQDINVTHIEINSFSKGSIITNFTIFFIKMDNLQLVILQEKMETTGLLSTMPVRYPKFNTTKVPSLSPTILTINNQTSTSIFLTWTHVPSIYLNNQNLSGYSIFYREKNGEYLPDQQPDFNFYFLDMDTRPLNLSQQPKLEWVQYFL